MKSIYLVLITTAFLFACNKEKITVDSLKGNWTFTEYEFYSPDSLGFLTQITVKETGYLNFRGDTIVPYNTNGIIVGNSKLPLLYSEQPSSSYYNNGNPKMLEAEFTTEKGDLITKKRGNKKNYFQNVFEYKTNSDVKSYNFELQQVSKNELRLKIVLKIDKTVNNGLVSYDGYTYINLKK